MQSWSKKMHMPSIVQPIQLHHLAFTLGAVLLPRRILRGLLQSIDLSRHLCGALGWSALCPDTVPAPGLLCDAGRATIVTLNASTMPKSIYLLLFALMHI